jgi:hypothetical protein
MDIKKFFIVNKILSIIVLVLLVLIFAALVWYKLSDTRKVPAPLSETQDNPANALDKLADFKTGIVKKINGSIITVFFGGKDQEVLITDATLITIQTEIKNGYKNIPGDLKSIKAGQQLVIFYEISKSNEFIATRVQILPF